jgi:hypothetical protein
MKLPAVALGLAALVLIAPAMAQAPRELVLEADDNIIVVNVGGKPVRLEVTGEAFGSPLVNPELVQRLGIKGQSRINWLFGPVSVHGRTAQQTLDFGHARRSIALAWSKAPVSARADGMIGIHHLPYDRVTFRLRPPLEGERVDRLRLRRESEFPFGNEWIGTRVKVDGQEVMAVFTPEFTRHNLVTAPTATFLATRFDGGFTPEAPSAMNIRFGVLRPIRMMKIARPLEIGSLALHRFAVRYKDYGTTTLVGEIAENDPRFEKDHIVVSRRRERGTPDMVRIGSEQLAHCSRLTYDFAARVIELSCAPQPYAG